MTIPMYLVDAFADTAFTGNPAAVYVVADGCADTWMQQVAAEMGQAETAFVSQGSDGWNLRWFTPLREVDLCGHATLATAHVLHHRGHVQIGETLRFHTRSGVLTATINSDDIQLDFPAITMAPIAPPEALIPALGVQPLAVFNAGPDIIVEVADAETVKTLTPDLEQLRFCSERGIGVTAAGSHGANGADIVSRFFAPAVGINEDAVTGSLYCALGPYWARRLRRNQLRSYQASARGGWINLTVQNDRILMAGQARTVVIGEWQTHD